MTRGAAASISICSNIAGLPRRQPRHVGVSLTAVAQSSYDIALPQYLPSMWNPGAFATASVDQQAGFSVGK